MYGKATGEVDHNEIQAAYDAGNEVWCKYTDENKKSFNKYLTRDVLGLRAVYRVLHNFGKTRLNIDITYGDSMMFSFTIDKDNGLKVHHYDGINSKYDSESTFYFSDDTIKDLVELFNRFDDYQLTSDDFKFLDSDPNSYQPNL